MGSPDGIRTRVTGLKGQRPRPLDDGASGGDVTQNDQRGSGSDAIIAHSDCGPVGYSNWARARRRRSRVVDWPSTSNDSNSGGLIIEPVAATRNG